MIRTTEEVAPVVYVEFDPTGKTIGIEVTSVRKRSADAKGTARAAE
jgi:uncharacterized protein YuzE